MTYDNTNSGALFKNSDKQSDKSPDYKGTLDVAGQQFWLSAWIKKSKGGQTYMSLAVKPKMASEYKGGNQNPPVREADEPAFDDQEIPF